MLSDAYENPISTLSNSAREAYDLGVHRFLGAEPGVDSAFQTAIDADEGFLLAHIGFAREMQLRGQPSRAKTSLNRARELTSKISDRERSHLNASVMLIEGEPAAARAAVYEHVKYWPKDVLVAQMCTSVFGLIGLSGLPGREAEQLAFVSQLIPHYEDNWWLRAQLAFAQLELGQLDEAAQNIETAISANPRSAHSMHIRAHLYYENMEDSDGLPYLFKFWKEYDPSGALYNHVSWHVGLWSLESGNLDQMWQVLDVDISPLTSKGPPLNVLTDSAALLFRAELAGVDVPAERWKALSSYASSRFPKTGLGFADVHAAITYARSGDRHGLNNIIESGTGPAGEITKTLAKGYREMEDQNWGRAAEYFSAILRDHARLGGSNAQRDLFDFSLASCLIKDGRQQEAKTILSITRPRALRNELVAGLI